MSTHGKLKESIYSVENRYPHVIDLENREHLNTLVDSPFVDRVGFEVEYGDGDGEGTLELLNSDFEYDFFVGYVEALMEVCEKAGVPFEERNFDPMYEDSVGDRQRTFPELGKDRLRTDVSVEEALQEYREQPHRKQEDFRDANTEDS